MSKEKPLVSILLCVYNCEKYIDECIKSIISQTFKKFEVIIIDDGSTDKSAELIEIFLKDDNRIKFYKKKNAGLTESLNYGISLTNSNYIIRLDADDLMFKKRIETIYNLILKSNADIVVNRSLVIDSNGKKLKRTKKLNYVLFKKYLLKGFSPVAHSSVIFKKEKIIELGLYSSFYEKSQDYDLWLRMLSNKAKFYFCNQTLTGLRIHSESLTSSEIDYYSIIALMNYKLQAEFNNSFSNEELLLNKKNFFEWISKNQIFRFCNSMDKSFFSKSIYFFLHIKNHLIYISFKKYAKRINPIKHI